MAFVDRGEASSAISHQFSQYQSVADFLKAMVDAAQKEIEKARAKEQEAKGQDEQTEPTAEPIHPELSKLDRVKESEQQQAMTEISALTAHDLVQTNGVGQDEEFYYQSESYTIHSTTPEAGEPTFRVTDVDHKEILSFQMVDGKPQILEEQLSPQDKLQFVGAASNIHTEGTKGVLSHPDANDRFARLGELSPAGTRAAWVAQQLLDGRDDYPPLGQPSQNRYQFERDHETGVCSVTDKQQGQILQIPQSGAVLSSMSREHLDGFKEIHTQMYRQQQLASQQSIGDNQTSVAKSAQTGTKSMSKATNSTVKSTASGSRSVGGR